MTKIMKIDGQAGDPLSSVWRKILWREFLKKKKGGKNGKDDENLWKSRRSLILGAKKDCKKRGRHHPTLPTTLSTLKIFLQNAEGGRGYYPLGNTRVTHKTRVYNCHHDASPPYLLSFWWFLSHDQPILSRQSDIEENEICVVILLMVNALYQCVSSLCEVASSRKTKMPNCYRKSTFLQKLFTWQKAKVFPLCEIVNRRIFE